MNEFELRGINYTRQVILPVFYKSKEIRDGYRIDLIVADQVVVEVKAVEKLLPVFDAQVLTYLKMSNKKVGLILNFCAPLLKNGIKRIVL